MAKNTHSQEILTGTSDSYNDHELSDPAPPVQLIITRPELGKVDRPLQPTAGTDSSPSSESDSKPNESENQSHQSLVPTTESHSNQPEGESSTADSTDGVGQRTHQPRSAKKAVPAKKTTGARARTMHGAEDSDDEFSDFE